MSVSSEVKRCALQAGFDLAGVAPLAAWGDLQFAQAWVESGYGGQMKYLKNPQRGDPRLILASVKSVVSVGLVYNVDLPYSADRDSHDVDRLRNPNPEPRAPGSSPRAWISRYAWGRDYHGVMKARLEQLRAAIEKLAPGVETRVYADTGPIVERAFARLSGMGWVGKNTCLINQEKGSWFFLGVVLTSLELEPDRPAFDRCGSCRRCLEACPTGALVEPYVMDASRCIAYFNIELRGSIPAEFRSAIGANVFGCDICQDVCPWNGSSFVVRSPSPAAGALAETHAGRPGTNNHPSTPPDRRQRPAKTALSEFRPLEVHLDPGLDPSQRVTNNEPRTPGDSPAASEPRVPSLEPRRFSLFHPRLEDLAALSEDDFRRVFAHSPIKRVKYRGWLRNLCVAMGNSGDPRFLPWLQKARLHEDPVVREHAEWALGRLPKQGR